MVVCCIGSFGIFIEIIFERLLQSTGRTFYTMIPRASAPYSTSSSTPS